MKLIIVESPTKAKTISKFIGKEYEVRASMGHIRDLPSSSKEIPAKYKGLKWATIGIDTDNNYEPILVISSGKSKIIKELKDLTAKADEVILAPDADREGESIAWHIKDVIKPKCKVSRIVFHEITKDAIEDALKHPGVIDMNMVHSQEARRTLDRLVGYSLSPVIWKKIAFGLSAGRVQSVALKIIIDREIERMKFVKGAYYSITAKGQLESILSKISNLPVVVSSDFLDDGTIKGNGFLITPENKYSILNELKLQKFNVSEYTEKEEYLNPNAPYITSSLQVDGNRFFGWSGKKTMQVAQKLYEQGLITYMRTDSTNLSTQAINGIRDYITNQLGNNYLEHEVRVFNKKAKGAQEAHEAIRPAGAVMKHVSKLSISGDEEKLYEIIFNRTIATQMKKAKFLRQGANVVSKDLKYTLRSTGSIMIFDGFLKVFGDNEEDKSIPKYTVGDNVVYSDFIAENHETKPPARYNDASLVKFLEKNGIGRPSTYANIIATLESRKYIVKENKQIIPTLTGFSVTRLLSDHFSFLVNTDFTSKMEEELDEIADGKVNWIKYLDGFYKGDKGLKNQIDIQTPLIDPKVINVIDLPKVKQYEIRVGKFGPFAVSSEGNISIPANIAPADLTDEIIADAKNKKLQSDEVYMIYQNNPVYLKSGSYGDYLEVKNNDEVVKRVGFSKLLKREDLTKEIAEKLLELPKTLENGDIINSGKFGLYRKDTKGKNHRMKLDELF